MSASEVAAHEIRTSLFRLVRRLRQERPEGELSYSQLNVLGWLEREGPMTNADLAAAERVTPQTMMRATADLVTSDLISRADNPSDGRSRLISLSEAGSRILDQVQPVLDPVRHAVLADFSEDELAGAELMLDRLLGGIAKVTSSR